MQEKRGEIFLFNGKTTAMIEKLITWTKNVKLGNFSKLPGLEIFLKTCNWEKENPELEGNLKQLVYLYLLSENFSLYFLEGLRDECKQYE